MLCSSFTANILFDANYFPDKYKKIPSIAQSLMQLAFPRKITCPLQVIILIFQNVIERNITFMYF
jgi:hypothetical protein